MAITVRRTVPARDTGYQLTHTLYKKVSFNTPGIQDAGSTANVIVGTYPADCCPLEGVIRINTTFDGNIIIGTSSNTSVFANTDDIVAGTADTYVTDKPYGTRSTVDRVVYVQLTSGTTVGEAEIWLPYLTAR